MNDNLDILIDIGIDNWSLCELLKRVINKLDEKDSRQYKNQVAFFKKGYEDRLKKIKIEFEISEKNEPYDPGMPVLPINISSFSAGSELFIEEVIKPIVLKDGKVLRNGEIILRGSEK